MLSDLIGCLAASMGFPAMLRGALGAVRQSNETLQTGGVSIAVEQFEPHQSGRYPGVILVHGADGLTLGPMYRAIASGLASWGYVVLMPHYFDRTGTGFPDDSTSRRHFGTWLETLSDTIGQASQLASVASERIGLVGVSLGAYLALAQASIDDRVKAVIEYFGGIPDAYAAQLRKMPPTLILHGEQDRVVPVSEAYELEKILRDKGQVCESKIYPGQGHVFTGQVAVDAMTRSAQFLEKHLKPNG